MKIKYHLLKDYPNDSYIVVCPDRYADRLKDNLVVGEREDTIFQAKWPDNMQDMITIAIDATCQT